MTTNTKTQTKTTTVDLSGLPPDLLNMLNILAQAVNASAPATPKPASPKAAPKTTAAPKAKGKRAPIVAPSIWEQGKVYLLSYGFEKEGSLIEGWYLVIPSGTQIDDRERELFKQAFRAPLPDGKPGHRPFDMAWVRDNGINQKMLAAGATGSWVAYWLVSTDKATRESVANILKAIKAANAPKTQAAKAPAAKAQKAEVFAV